MTGAREIRADVAIAGGGCGGVAAALSVLRGGRSCILIEPTAMLGGQLTSQGVPPDENRWIEGNGPGAPGFVGATASYAAFREAVRRHYREHESLTDEGASNKLLDPGGGWVSRLCFAPRLGDPILRSMLAAAARDHGGTLTVLDRAEVIAVERGPRAGVLGPLRVRDGDGRDVIVHAALYLDATETGDLLELGSVEHFIGGESERVYGELHARDDLPSGLDRDPLDQQAVTWCFAVEHRPGEDHTVERPASYDYWRACIPEMTPPWTGPLFDWTVPSHNEAGRIRLPLVPWPDEPAAGELELWRYRQIVDSTLHTDGRADVSLFNCVQMDYWRSPLLGVSAEKRAAALEGAREQSRAFLYWMQTEAPRHDGGTGYPGLRLRGDELGSDDGFALACYIREPRRLDAVTVLTERHLGTAQRRRDGAPNQDATADGAGEPFADSVAIGHYPIDLHPSCAGRNNVYVPACPFRVPMGALIPRRVENLLAAGKCLGVSHVANGSTRLHPVEWGVGEAAGALACACLDAGMPPRAYHARRGNAAAVRERLARLGCPTAWPWEEG